jgi:hypothetical protein
MFQRRLTIPGGASVVLARVRGVDTQEHELNALGAKTFRGHAYNPTGPQRRIIVTKNVPATTGWIAPRIRIGTAPPRAFKFSS